MVVWGTTLGHSLELHLGLRVYSSKPRLWGLECRARASVGWLRIWDFRHWLGIEIKSSGLGWLRAVLRTLNPKPRLYDVFARRAPTADVL